VFYNVRDFGAQGNGLTDDLPAFERALEAMKPIPPLLYVKGGGILLVPAGNYYLSQTLVITHEVQIAGISGHPGNGTSEKFYRNAAGIPQFPNGLPGGVTRLLFPRGVTGIRVAYDASSGEPERGAGSIVRNLVLVGEFEEGVDSREPNQYINPEEKDPAKKIFNPKYLIPKVPTDPSQIGHGISAKLRVVIDNCCIYHFNGNGIHFVAPSDPPSAKDDPNGELELLDFKNPELGNLYLDNAYVVDGLTIKYRGNVIDSRVADCFVRGNGLNGVYIFGSNSGNLTFDKVHCIGNGRYGFFDSERSAANLYLGCHSQGNLKGGYYCLSSILAKNKDGSLTYEVKNDTGSIYIGCYQENAGTRIYAPAMVIGGALGTDGIILSDPDPDAESLKGKNIDTKDLYFNPPSIMRTNSSNGNANTAFPNGVQAYCGGNFYGGAIALGGGEANVALTLYHGSKKDNEGRDILNTDSKYKLRYVTTKESASVNPSLHGWWQVSMSEVGTSAALRFSTEESAVGINQLWLENGMYIGNGSSSNADDRVLVRTGAAQPTTTNGNPGDIIFNSNPVANGYAGWIFVAGTGWRPYGKIE
jgi:hypothetical protein